MTLIKKIVEYLHNLCYDFFRIEGNKKGSTYMKLGLNSGKKGILDAKEFACYIKTRYNEKYQDIISPIKLQKSLYFCFAHWGGFINKSKGTEEEIKQNSYLFDETFKAWSYGPVVPVIYHEEQEGNLNKKVTEEELFGTNKILKDTINSLLDDLFEISDFKLVNISHADKCWQDNFDPKAKKHDKKIDSKDIIHEYTYKY